MPQLTDNILHKNDYNQFNLTVYQVRYSMVVGGAYPQVCSTGLWWLIKLYMMLHLCSLSLIL